MNELIEPLITMVISLVALLVSSNIAIKNSVKLSELTGLGKSRIGFTFVATLTSLPELAVTLFATISGEAVVSIGNVLGSNVANISLIIGLGLLLYALKLKKKELVTIKFKPEELDMFYLGIFTASVIPILLISFLPASQIVGGLLIVIYIYYTYKIIAKRELLLEELEEPREASKSKKTLITCIVLAILGIIGVALSADFLVDSTVKLALLLEVSPSIISATIIAIGTSFPELFISIQSMLAGHTDLAFGNVVGSNFTNITLIFGITLLLSPVRLNIKVFSDLVTFSILANILLWYLMHRGGLGWREGLYLLILYSLFLSSIMGILVFPE